MLNDFMKGFNSKPITSIMMHIEDMEKVDINLNELEGFEGKILRIAHADIFMTEKQSEQLFETLEKELFDESFRDIEDKYMSEKGRADRLEEELEFLKEKYGEVLIYG